MNLLLISPQKKEIKLLKMDLSQKIYQILVKNLMNYFQNLILKKYY